MAASPSPTDPDDQFAIGSVLDGRYRIDGVLGTGGMGRVYRAEHTKIGKSVAIKVLHADLHRNREASQRFQREAIASGRLDHPNIVGVSDFGVLDDGTCYLVMEVLEGESLGDRLARDGHLAWLEAVDVLRGVLAGLRHAHERGVVHRDIKPDNIYLATKDGESMVKILDFGIAKLYAGSADDPASTRAGLTVGTPAYLSPEQAVGGEITPASDLYSASVVMYEMLAGRAPFEDKDPLAMLGAHVGRRPPAFSVTAPGVEVPPPLEDIVQRGLIKAAAERIATATDYLAWLDTVAPPAVPHGHVRMPTSPTPMLTASEALGLAATGSALSAWPASQPRTATPPPELVAAPALDYQSRPVATPPGTPSGAPSSSASIPAYHPTPYSGSAVVPVPGGVAAPVSGPVHATPYAGTPIATANESALSRARRMVSLADVKEPIPKSWIIRSGILVGLGLLVTLVLLFVKHCGGDTQPIAAPTGAAAGSARPAAKPPAAPPTRPTAAPSSAPPPPSAGSGSDAGSGSSAGSDAGSAKPAPPKPPPPRQRPGHGRGH